MLLALRDVNIPACALLSTVAAQPGDLEQEQLEKLEWLLIYKAIILGSWNGNLQFRGSEL